MAEYHQQQGETHNVSGRSMVCTSLAGVAVTAPLLGMMGFSFMATLVLLVISSPLLFIFSPLLLCVGLVFAGALAGFAVAATMALAGVSTLAWMYREIGGSAGVGCGMTGRLAEFGDRVKEQGKDWAGYLQQNSPDAYSQ
ncbi:hypothetical protein QUC31_001534 [Theobroma cacao]|uniref:Oleosin 16 kDa n=2 Tax=Theobroma cacao TaxID=3641 RepID=A0AB32UWN2_THECC|nr:PREDICTED: oleosin 16 kDa [Theobroma cacao]EOY11882.1 Glycine-rich protein / oleosin, putative [Theobroma cacao]WRX28162.1 Oleosin - like 5 [Theobroma cacao]